jgi:eukaryotic-like serine/threonine-protein kinase
MPDAKVTITVIDPTVPEKQFVFDGPKTCVVGRETDCDITLPADLAHREVSRHHCLLDIKPPYIRVRDLNSTNGTFVNDKRLEAERTAPEDTTLEEGGTATLQDGDEIRVALTRLKIHVVGYDEILASTPARQRQMEVAPVLGQRRT